MEFLTRAEEYAQFKGDAIWFQDWYWTFRNEYGVRDSVWNTLAYLYDDAVADELEQDSALLSTACNV